jgi:hypothetical protein
LLESVGSPAGRKKHALRNSEQVKKRKWGKQPPEKNVNRRINSDSINGKTSNIKRKEKENNGTAGNDKGTIEKDY